MRPPSSLRDALAERSLSPQHAQDLLAAFKLDVTKLRYRDWDDLIGYCSLSAMPVGRFVLDVHGESRSIWPANDALCAALQIINHLQDCKADYRNLDRVYVPLDALARMRRRRGGARRAAGIAGTARRLHGLAERTERLLGESDVFPLLINDWRLALEVSVINTLAHRLTRLLMTRDPLSERVHLSVPAIAGLTLVGMLGGASRRLGRRLFRHDAKAAGCVSEQTHASGRARLRQLVLYRHAHSAACAARGDVRNLFVLPRGRRHRRRSRARANARREQLAHWRSDIDAVYRGAPPPALAGLAQAVRGFDLQREDFIAIIDGMEMDVVADIRAPDRATLDLYCDRVACAVGRLSVRVFGMEHDAGIALAHHLGRALQLTNILRDLDEDAALGRLYLPREALQRRGIISDRAGARCWRIRRSARPAATSSSWRRANFDAASSDHGAKSAPRGAGAAHHGRGLSHHSRRLVARGFAPPRAAGPPAARATPVHRAAQSL